MLQMGKQEMHIHQKEMRTGVMLIIFQIYVSFERITKCQRVLQHL